MPDAQVPSESSAIPEGPYCYTITGAPRTGPDGVTRVPTRTCPHWRVIEADPDGGVVRARRELLGVEDEEGRSALLFDQLKLCGINEGEDAPDEDQTR